MGRGRSSRAAHGSAASFGRLESGDEMGTAPPSEPARPLNRMRIGRIGISAFGLENEEIGGDSSLKRCQRTKCVRAGAADMTARARKLDEQKMNDAHTEPSLDDVLQEAGRRQEVVAQREIAFWRSRRTECKRLLGPMDDQIHLWASEPAGFRRKCLTPVNRPL